MNEKKGEGSGAGPDLGASHGYQVPDDVLTASLEDEAVLLHMESKRYYRLNETGSCIWKGLQEGLDRQELITHLRDRFDVDRARLEEELEEFISRLDDQGLLRSPDTGSADDDRGHPCNEPGSA